MAESSLTYPITSRQQAKSQGLTNYFTGKPCKAGHIALRNVKNWTCIECTRIRVVTILKSDSDAQECNRERAARWYRDNHEQALINFRSRRKNLDPIKIKRQYAAWLERNRDHVRQYNKRWVKANPARISARTHNRRTRKLSAEGRYTASDIRALMAAQQGLCAGCKCDISKRHSVDHKTPLCRGGSNWPDNLQLLCKSCNCKKGRRTMEEWLRVKF